MVKRLQNSERITLSPGRSFNDETFVRSRGI